MQQRYQVLRRLQPVIRIAAWVVGGFYIIVAIANVYMSLAWSRAINPPVRMAGTYGFVAAVSLIVMAGLWWLALTVVAELIGVFLDTEENTRLTATLLQEPEEESESPT
jgi:hypothetical protein